MNTKKNILFVGIMILLFYASCYKEGDLDALKNPIRVELDPTIGVPLVSTHIEVEDLFGLLDDVNSYVKFGENGELILVYADSTQTFLNTNLFSKSSVVSDVIEGELNVDIFENIDKDSLSFNVGNVFLTLDCFSKTEFGDVPLVLKGIEIKSELIDGTQNTVLYIDSIAINDLQGVRTSIIDHIDISDIINSKPSKFLYSFEALIDLSRLTTEGVEAMPDSIELDFYFDLEMVLSGSTPGIYFKDTMDFNMNLDIKDIKVEESKFILEISNNLPFEIDIALDFADSLHNHLCYVFDTPEGHYDIKPAKVDDKGYVVAPTLCKVEIPFDSEKIELYNKTKKIHMSTFFSTPNNGEQIVTLQKQNGLMLRLGAILHPVVSTDFSL